MKHPLLTAILLMILACLQPASAFSPIWTIDGWDMARLKDVGISVESWKHDEIGEDPPVEWVHITYDTSKAGKNLNVLMTLVVAGENGQTISASRAEHKKGDPDKLTLLFAVPKKNVEMSSVEILIPKLLAAEDKALGHSAFGGYRLSLSRVMELAGKPEAAKK